MAYAEESSGDFDVFSTSEGVPIKLDLAQAYINMQDIDGAKTVLNDIIAQHRGKIVTAAQEMLKKISPIATLHDSNKTYPAMCLTAHLSSY